jgi:hypothetical protein
MMILPGTIEVGPWQICPSTNLPAPACPWQARFRASPARRGQIYLRGTRHHAPCPTAFSLMGNKPMVLPQEGPSDGLEKQKRVTIPESVIPL